MHSLRIIYTDVPDRAVGTANRYRLDSPSIEPQWGARFSYTSMPALGPTQQLVTGLSCE
jgi:hypothetical protein